MQLSHEQRGNIIIVTPLERRMDASIAGDFRKEMETLIREGQGLFILDLSRVDFVDSSGVGAIIACLRMLEGKGDLTIAGASEKVANLFRLTRADRLFRIFPSSDDALAGFSCRE